jgi:hypothetical protein
MEQWIIETQTLLFHYSITSFDAWAFANAKASLKIKIRKPLRVDYISNF